MPDPLKLFSQPPSNGPLKLPPAKKIGGLDLALEGLLSPLGLGSNPDDPELYQLPQEEKNKLIRSQALGDALGMTGAPAGAMMLLPKIRGLATNRDLLNRKTLEATPDALKGVTEWAMSKFPRLMSHVQAPYEINRAPWAGAQIGQDSTLGNISRIGINPGALGNAFDSTETMAHELTHTAQNLRRADEGPGGMFDTSRADKAYDAMENIAGYFHNPFERRAREAGLNQANRVLRSQRAEEGPLLPGVMTNKNIHEWAQAVASNPAVEEKAVKAKIVGGPMVARPSEAQLDAAIFGNNGPYLADVNAALDARKAQAQHRLQTFGSSPVGKQGKLNFEEEAPFVLDQLVPPEFRLHSTEVKPQPPKFKSPAQPTAESMNANAKPPRYGGDGKSKAKLSKAPPVPGSGTPAPGETRFGEENGRIWDITSLHDTMGVAGARSRIEMLTKSGSPTATVRIRRFGPQGQMREPEEFDIPSQLADQLLAKANGLERKRGQ